MNVITIETFKICLSGFISFLITLYIVPLCVSLAKQLQFIDIPDGKIKKHEKPIPYLGGVAVYCGFLCGLAIVLPLENRMVLFIIGTSLLLLIGLIDDFVVLKPYQKFAGQILSTLCFLKAGFYLKEHVFYNFWNIPISALWILTVINAFNLVDIMDGLATVLAIGATISFIGIAIVLKNYTALMVLLPFLGSLCAFLWYNRPNAQIYLGDAGSLFLGGFLATIPFLLQWGTYNTLGYLTPLIVLGIPLLEVISLIIIRMYKHIPFYRGSPDHFACYLQAHGWSKYGILSYVLSVSIILGVISLLFVSNILSFFITSILGAIFLTIWMYIVFYE